MLKFFVILCLSHMSNGSFMVRERWTYGLFLLNNVFDCRSLIIDNYCSYDLETRCRVEKLLSDYVYIDDLLFKDVVFRLEDFGVRYNTNEFRDIFLRSYRRYYGYSYSFSILPVDYEPLRHMMVKVYLEGKMSSGYSRNDIKVLIRRAVNKKSKF